jgi:hypothetical protein
MATDAVLFPLLKSELTAISLTDFAIYMQNSVYMRCPAAVKLIISLKERVRTMKVADTNMRNANIALRSRKENWDTSVMRLAAVRAELEDHKLTCQMCGGMETGWSHSAVRPDAF